MKPVSLPFDGCVVPVAYAGPSFLLPQVLAPGPSSHAGTSCSSQSLGYLMFLQDFNKALHWLPCLKHLRRVFCFLTGPLTGNSVCCCIIWHSKKLKISYVEISFLLPWQNIWNNRLKKEGRFRGSHSWYLVLLLWVYGSAICMVGSVVGRGGQFTSWGLGRKQREEVSLQIATQGMPPATWFPSTRPLPKAPHGSLENTEDQS